jgi:hypothetical protein
MSWRFRKSFKVLPGVRLNLTRHGLSATLGAAPFSLNVGPRGVYSNVSIPGTGIWNRQRLDPPPPTTPGERHPPPFDHDVTPRPMPLAMPAYADVTEIRSASTEKLKSQSMGDLQGLLEEAYEERSTLDQEIAASTWETNLATKRYRSWEKGFLFKHVFSKSFATRKGHFEMAQAKLDELREQLRLTVLATQIDIDPEQAEPYYKMRDEFAAMSECQTVWDTLERRSIDRVASRSAASEAITREPVAFALGSCDLIQWDQKVPHLPNRTGGDLYIYPGFALYRAAKKAFAIIDSREIRLISSPTRFIEDETVPSDAEVMGHAWAKSNKDGSPDRRFRDNYQIPIVLYGSLKFTSPGGLQEEFQISNAALAERFARAWNSFHASFAPTGQRAVGGTAHGDTSMLPIRPIAHPEDQTSVEKLDAEVVFAKESEKAKTLAVEHGEFWEFLLTEELLRTRLLAVEAEYNEFDKALLSIPKRRFGGPEFISWLSGKMGEVTPMVSEIARCVNELLPASLGKPGESGDAIQILRAVDALFGCCRAFLAWELDVCAADPPLKLKRLGAVLRGITSSVIGDLRRFLDELGRAIEGVRGGSNEFRVHIELSSSPQLAKFAAEIDKVNKHPEWVRAE